MKIEQKIDKYCQIIDSVILYGSRVHTKEMEIFEKSKKEAIQIFETHDKHNSSSNRGICHSQNSTQKTEIH